ncbi:MAG TPA: Gp37 family protein [Candidatus Binataceae bacterium]|nr:Gp37 family protein [Candidatus Binataceae bacterium]
MAAAVLDSPWTGTSFAPPTPLDIATIENAILTQLRSAIGTIEIAHYPDRPESYRMTHRIGAALVRYEGARYERLMDTAAVVQERRLQFEITLMMRDLGWGVGGQADGTSPGAYALIEEVRAALTGFRVPGCSKMYPLRERFAGRDKQGAVWVYAIRFGLTTAAVEPSSADNFPLFVKGIAQEQSGLTAISLAPAPYTFNTNGQIQLPQGNVSEVALTDPASGIAYKAGTDYSVDAVNGIITRNPSGAIAAGATVDAAYTYAETATAAAGGGNAPTAPTN